MTEEGPGAALTVVQAAAGALHALLLLALFTEFSYKHRRGARAAGRPTQSGGTDGGRGHFGPRLQARLPRSLQPHIVLMRFIMFDFCLGYTPAVCRFWQGRWPRLPSCWALCGCTIRAACTNLTSLPFRQAACVGPLCRLTSALRHLVASACSTQLPRSWFAGDYGPCTAAAGDHSTAGTSVVRAQRHAGVPAGPCDVARQPQPEERPRHRARAPGWPPGSAGYLMSGAPSWWCTTMVLVATRWSQHAGFQPCTSCAPHGAGKQQAAVDLLHGCSLLLGTPTQLVGPVPCIAQLDVPPLLCDVPLAQCPCAGPTCARTAWAGKGRPAALPRCGCPTGALSACQLCTTVASALPAGWLAGRLLLMAASPSASPCALHAAARGITLVFLTVTMPLPLWLHVLASLYAVQASWCPTSRP